MNLRRLILVVSGIAIVGIVGHGIYGPLLEVGGTHTIEITSQGKKITVAGYYADFSRESVDGGTQIIIGNHAILVANGILEVNREKYPLAEFEEAKIWIEKSGALTIELTKL